MPDISMCRNKECKLSKDCLRYIAIPDQRQSYSEFMPNTNKMKVKDILSISNLRNNFDESKKKDVYCNYFIEANDFEKIQYHLENREKIISKQITNVNMQY